LESVDRFNHKQLLSAHIPPAEAEAAYYQQTHDSP
jgi:hypothetical protein